MTRFLPGGGGITTSGDGGKKDAHMIPTPTFATLRTEIAGVAILDLAREFGSPAYVYDAARISQRLKDLAAFD